jgi:hypothetical protein
MPGNRRRNSIAAENSPRCRKMARISAACASLTTNIARACEREPCAGKRRLHDHVSGAAARALIAKCTSSHSPSHGRSCSRREHPHIPAVARLCRMIRRCYSTSSSAGSRQRLLLVAAAAVPLNTTNLASRCRLGPCSDRVLSIRPPPRAASSMQRHCRRLGEDDRLRKLPRKFCERLPLGWKKLRAGKCPQLLSRRVARKDVAGRKFSRKFFRKLRPHGSSSSIQSTS